ncbi:hypothetical protein GPECTOR_907g163 [Gonium pectorale]|uniref:Reverse transcriptase domain-containing protein n=1 Tax=Gonium pectorale TaxID=33097 RepID=A0A150FV30_GONPE|nr:hypothetical protein GPECTOR_907g163 [Gonium pectorale]|eukprot:KXZ41045.1 hypothetical protein GPECTOR_907g163 [Gonium pectorale]
MGAHFDALLATGVTEAYDPAAGGSVADFAAVINPLHVVPKPDGDIRPIIDPTRSGVNECMRQLPCQLPDLHDLLTHLPAGGFLGKRDLASGFHHVKLCPEARRYMAFRHPVTNELQRYVALPFGASQSPPIFVELTSAATAIFQAECDRHGLSVRLFTYVDDFMIMGATHSDVVGAFAVMDDLGAELGLEWKASKDHGRDVPLQQLEFLGLLFDTVALEMRIPPGKRQRYGESVSQLLAAAAAGPVERTAFEAVAGRLTFIARACRWGYAFLQGIYDCYPVAARQPPPCVALSAAAVEDLQFWQRILDSSTSLWDGVKRCSRAEIDLVRGEFTGADGAVIFTDASGLGFGAAWDAAELQGEWADPAERRLHIAWLELTAVLRALQAWAPRLAGKRVLVRCDNTQAVAAINHGSTRVRDGRSISRQVAELAIRHGFEVRAEHIAGAENVRADRLSRQLQTARSHNLRLKASIFRRLVWRDYRPSVDCCCDVLGLNMQPGCTVFFSAEDSVLGRERDLAGRVLWAFPPQELAGEVLATIAAAAALDASTKATVVVPDWPQRPWHNRYVVTRRKRQKSPFRLLERLPAGERPLGEERCAACGGACGRRDLRCESCPGCAHRRCLGVAAGAYPGGWFRCGRCVLAAAGLADWHCSPQLLALADNWVRVASSAVAGGSADTYTSNRRRYVRFCEEQCGVPEEVALPRAREQDVNPQLVCLFIAHAVPRYAKSTVTGTLSALSDWQRSRGVAAEATVSRHPLVRRTLVQALRGKAGTGLQTAPRAKAPLPLGILRVLVGWLWLSSRNEAADKRKCVLFQDQCWLVCGFFGMLRRSELTALTVGDVGTSPSGGVLLRIRRSKADQLGAGAVVALAGQTRSGIPIAKIMARHQAARLAAGARAVDPLFVAGPPNLARGPAWPKSQFSARLRQLLAELVAAGLVPELELTDYAAHSLRRGGATAAANAGISVDDIKSHGRWRSEAVLGYIRRAEVVQLRVTGRM